MEWVPFDLRGTTIIGAYNHTRCVAAERQCGGVEVRNTRGTTLGLAVKGCNLFRGHVGAASDASKSERGPHQFEERTPAQGIPVELSGTTRELSLE